MPADIFIETGQRTCFNYLMRPVLDSFSRAFREHRAAAPKPLSLTNILVRPQHKA